MKFCLKKITLLNFESHAQSHESINMIFSQKLQPTVVHPTRITSSTSTLITNIFISNNLAPKFKVVISYL